LIRPCLAAEIRMRAWLFVDRVVARLAEDRECVARRTDAAIADYIRARMREARP